MEQPWERGWEPVDGPAPQSEHIETKVTNDAIYHLWKSPQGDETIQKGGDYYRVSPGAFNTIPTQSVRTEREIAGPKNQT